MALNEVDWTLVVARKGHEQPVSGLGGTIVMCFKRLTASRSRVHRGRPRGMWSEKF